ncbi:beta-glucan synthesis-associated protein-domain-containing protein [Lyophyllum atratum]|nr:beta-glucan synthesis-associated protein-domain-containing protein [Lyophyllum atratum]
MSSRPQSWVEDYAEVEFDLPYSDTTPSGRNSPHERQRMLADEAAQPTRPVYGLDNTPGASSSTYGTRTSHSTPASTSNGLPRYSSQEPPIELSRGTSPEAGSSRIPRAGSYRSVTSSPLNPSFPSGPPSSHILSPFARPGSRGSAHITRIPSEESRALSLGSPLGMNSTGARGSMILYRRAEASDDALLPPSLPHRSSMISNSGDSFVSLSSDSKYPAGMMTPERGLIAYAYDPSLDDGEAMDDMDVLHDPRRKVVKVAGRPMSWRGFKNIAALLMLIVALLTLFVFYPVYLFFTDNGVKARIVGNTRINATGQAEALSFDPRSQVPLTSLWGVIDPATPKGALSRAGREGTLYTLVFSDEFNTDGRTFSEDDDPVWEAIGRPLDHDPQHITTRDGHLIIPSYTIPSDGSGPRRHVSDVLRQRSPYCLEDGYVEISAVMPWGSSEAQKIFWTGSWTTGRDTSSMPEMGESASGKFSLHLSIGAAPPWPISGHSRLLIDYVRFYQKTGVPVKSCQGDEVRHRRLDFFDKL